LLEDIAADVAALPFAPGLAVVLVGDAPASKVYVANKTRQTVQVGIKSFEHRLPAAQYAHGGAGCSRKASGSFLKKEPKNFCLMRAFAQ
jgi:hypothetical protein